MASKNEVPLIAKPVKTWQLVKGFIKGLDQLEDVRFGELVSIPLVPGSYSDIGEDAAKRLGNTATWYVGYSPVFEPGKTTPIAFDVCFHTGSMGVCPILRIGALDSLDSDTINEINDLKMKANRAIAQVLDECGCNDILIRYQWYACLLEHLGIPLKPGNPKEKIGSVIDVASDEAGFVGRSSKYGIAADDSTAAIKVLDKLGFTFKAPRKMPPTYPKDLNAYTATLLKDGSQYQIVVSRDLEPYLTGSKAEILTDHNDAISHFRPVFASTAKKAGELFMRQIGATSSNTRILTDEDPDEEIPDTFNSDEASEFDDIPEIPEARRQRGNPATPVGRKVLPEQPLSQGSQIPEEQEARQFIREQGYRLIKDSEGLLLVRVITPVRNAIEAADIVEDEEEPNGMDGMMYPGPYYDEEPRRPEWMPPEPRAQKRPIAPKQRPDIPRRSDPSLRRSVIHPRGNRTPELPEEPVPDDAIIEIRIQGNRNRALFEGEVIAEDRSAEGLEEQVSELIAQHPDFKKAKVMYRHQDGRLTPDRPASGAQRQRPYRRG